MRLKNLNLPAHVLRLQSRAGLCRRMPESVHSKNLSTEGGSCKRILTSVRPLAPGEETGSASDGGRKARVGRDPVGGIVDARQSSGLVEGKLRVEQS